MVDVMEMSQWATADAEIAAELAQIEAAHGGVLNPPDVVEFARNPATKLHSRFCWDDTEAAQRYRLWQARCIINVRVVMEPKINEPVRVYVSLPSDRRQGGGYRTMVSVLSDEERRAEMIQQSLSELMRVRQKYRQLTELKRVFTAIDQTVEKFAKPKKRPA